RARLRRGSRRLHREPAAVGGRGADRDDVGVGPGPAERRGGRARAVSAPSVVWFRRDLRLADHPALSTAAADGPVVPLFVLDPRFLSRAGAPRLAFLLRGLAALDESMGGALLVRTGDPVDVVPAVAAEAKAAAVHVTADFGPYGRR